MADSRGMRMAGVDIVGIDDVMKGERGEAVVVMEEVMLSYSLSSTQPLAMLDSRMENNCCTDFHLASLTSDMRTEGAATSWSCVGKEVNLSVDNFDNVLVPNFDVEVVGCTVTLLAEPGGTRFGRDCCFVTLLMMVNEASLRMCGSFRPAVLGRKSCWGTCPDRIRWVNLWWG
jgi:hypothetical protein